MFRVAVTSLLRQNTKNITSGKYYIVFKRRKGGEVMQTSRNQYTNGTSNPNFIMKLGMFFFPKFNKKVEKATAGGLAVQPFLALFGAFNYVGINFLKYIFALIHAM